jgi:hypothetical protein
MLLPGLLVQFKTWMIRKLRAKLETASAAEKFEISTKIRSLTERSKK